MRWYSRSASCISQRLGARPRACSRATPIRANCPSSERWLAASNCRHCRDAAAPASVVTSAAASAVVGSSSSTSASLTRKACFSPQSGVSEPGRPTCMVPYR